MKRREFIAGLGGAATTALAPSLLRAQPAKLARVGILDTTAPGEYTDRSYWSAFRAEMATLGYREGGNIAFHPRYAYHDLTKLPALTEELIRVPVDVIVAQSTPTALAAKSVTTKVPVVVPLMADPVGIGLAASLARPGGNITGLSTISAELSAKRLELLRDIIPSLTRVAILWEDENPAFALAVEHTRSAARSYAMTLQVLPLRSSGGFDKALDAIAEARAQALVVAVPASASFGGDLGKLTALIAARRLPAVYAEVPFVAAGGLASYGPDYVDLFRRAAAYADKILKGAAATDLPIEEPRKFELALNLKAAKALGLSVPPTLIARADQVIE